MGDIDEGWDSLTKDEDAIRDAIGNIIFAGRIDSEALDGFDPDMLPDVKTLPNNSAIVATIPYRMYNEGGNNTKEPPTNEDRKKFKEIWERLLSDCKTATISEVQGEFHDTAALEITFAANGKGSHENNITALKKIPPKILAISQMIKADYADMNRATESVTKTIGVKGVKGQYDEETGKITVEGIPDGLRLKAGKLKDAQSAVDSHLERIEQRKQKVQKQFGIE